MPHNVPTIQQTIEEVFGIPGRLVLEIRQDAHPMVPGREELYVFRRETLQDLMMWLKGAAGIDPLYLTGHTGTGKSSVITQVAARLGTPLYVVSCHERMEIPELFGRFVVRNGSMEWADGPLLQGLKDPSGAWVLLDEIDSLDPGTFIGLNALLEGRSIMIPETGETIDPLRFGARIIAAGNTAGAGDRSGLYQATKRQNLASMGRFMVVEVDYPDPEVEVALLSKLAPAVPQELRESMVRLANEARKLFKAGEIEVVFCTRSLTRWACLSTFMAKIAQPGEDPMAKAMDRAIGNRAEPDSRQALHELWQRVKAGE